MPSKRNLIAVLALLLTFGVFTGCDTGSAVDDANLPAVQNISVAEAKALLDRNAVSADFIILDVRTPSEYAQGHIPGAVNLDYYASFEASLSAFDKTKTYLVYCRTGNRSASAARLMLDNGFAAIYNMQGGINAWISGGLPLET
ncbi:MAG: rhodanese-like domain protein [Dehalococcoides mccartyi]|uniref:Sulfurtransferase n=1 Tax=Dehalococcoides mccartyi TaxID=61435 RepID=A0A0V8M2G0_9CHLR|nr:rhodanese-like domain-containing protein [Dehalococcoides mccartyi]AQU03606.1 sulfurtransferase [Dehalococcoides mccartyi]AQU04906.1 sulfurtransferase [Dehalococcoides mccartyi]KSV17965.1 sulfurtransferase [Dehalococcoides mccartyi]MCF7635690.1 rhodanese-like domain protein [Dehalococcoides mccartyi]MEA2121104.1 Thiosulfate sulfurtransferase GlpE [Dehalococcoides mccartyi]